MIDVEVLFEVDVQLSVNETGTVVTSLPGLFRFCPGALHKFSFNNTS